MNNQMVFHDLVSRSCIMVIPFKRSLIHKYVYASGVAMLSLHSLTLVFPIDPDIIFII